MALDHAIIVGAKTALQSFWSRCLLIRYTVVAMAKYFYTFDHNFVILSKVTFFLHFKTVSEPKSESQLEFIRNALQNNVFLKVLDSNQTNQLIDCMKQQTYSIGSNVITEGEYGSHLFVLENGKVSGPLF